MERVIVVGGGLAGVRTVEALRAHGYSGGLTLIGAEPHKPYDRPPLSKAVLTGSAEDTTVDADWAALDVDLRLGEEAIGLAPGRLETAGGAYAFDRLVIATGAAPVRLPGSGPQRTLRTIDDARELRAALRPGVRLAVVGAGWIGAEVATAAAAAGCRVSVVEAGPAPLSVAVGAAVGGLTAPWYAAAGVDLRLGVRVEGVEPGGLALAGGEFLEADEVLVGVGVRPVTGWLRESPVALDNGVAVTARLETSVPGIYAVGDVAAFESGRYGRRLRVEHWDAALNAPDVVARNLLGGRVDYDPVPYFWSEQFGRMVQYAGHHPAGGTLVRRGDPAEPKWAVCWLAGDRLAAILTVGRPRDLVQARRAMEARARFDPAGLADPAVPIKDAVAS